MKNRDKGTMSSAICVILMVAIIVFPAVLIAGFVFGITGNIQKIKMVVATESRINFCI
jgi:FlaG/FlaF family flagellin (archaellin)